MLFLLIFTQCCLSDALVETQIPKDFPVFLRVDAIL